MNSEDIVRETDEEIGTDLLKLNLVINGLIKFLIDNKPKEVPGERYFQKNLSCFLLEFNSAATKIIHKYEFLVTQNKLMMLNNTLRISLQQGLERFKAQVVHKSEVITRGVKRTKLSTGRYLNFSPDRFAPLD